MEIPSFFAWLFFFLFSCLLFVLFTNALRFPSTNPSQKLEKENKNPTKPIVASITISLITLPEDLLINEILPRLPVKSLVRFQSVSKPWKTLITDHKFITNHLNRTTGSTHRSHRNKLVAVKHRRRRFPSAHAVALLSSETNGLVATLAIPLETELFESLKIVGSANGLLCLADHECRSDPGLPTILWNPSLNKLRALPRSVFGENRPYQERVARVIHGFGYHHETDDHKIIRVLHVYDKLDVLCFRAEVFSLRQDSWRAVESSFIIGHKMFEASCVAANGVLHWIAFGIGSLRDSEFVLCFDLGLEEFRRLELPCAAEGFSSRFGLCKNKLAERGGKLCLLSYTHHGWDKWVQVWDFDEKIHAWERKISVGPFVGIARPLGCGWSGEIYLEDKNGRLVLYNPNTDEVRKIKPVWAELYSYEAHLYVESLVWKD